MAWLVSGGNDVSCCDLHSTVQGLAELGLSPCRTLLLLLVPAAALLALTSLKGHCAQLASNGRHAGLDADCWALLLPQVQTQSLAL